jgi:hypothetical protein
VPSSAPLGTHFAILGKPMVSRVARPFVTFSLFTFHPARYTPFLKRSAEALNMLEL